MAQINKVLFIFLMFVFTSLEVQAQRVCTIHLGYACNSPTNDSCLDKKYCQATVNFCAAYKNRFANAAEVKAYQKKYPQNFAEGFNLSKFMADVNRCKSGTWTAAYSKSSKSFETEPDDKSGLDWAEAALKAKEVNFCSSGGGSAGIPESAADPLGEAFCLNSMIEKKSLKPEDAGENPALTAAKLTNPLVGVVADSIQNPGTLMDGEVDPQNSNISRSDLKYKDDVDKIKDNSFYATNSVDQTERLKAMKALAYERFKASSHLDVDFLEKCTGKKINTDDLFQLRFEDDSMPLGSKSMGAKFSQKVKNQCLKVEFTPQMAHWASIMRLATRGNEFVDRSNKNNPRVIKCANISDERYCGRQNTSKVVVDAVANSVLSPSADIDVGCGLNINTYGAGRAGGTFGIGDPRDKTFLSGSHRQGICDFVKRQMSANSSSASQQNVFKQAESMYFEQCKANDNFYGWVQTGFQVGTGVAVVAGTMVFPGTLGLLVGTSVSVGTTATQTYFNCYREIPESVVYGGNDEAYKKLAEAQSACYTRAAKDGTLDGVINLATAGAAKGLRTVEAQVVQRFAEDSLGEGLEISARLMRDQGLKKFLGDAAIGRLFKGPELGFQFSAEYARCQVQRKYVDEKMECSTSSVLTNIVQGQIISRSVGKAMNTSKYQSATPEGKKQILETAKTEAMNTTEFKTAPQKVAQIPNVDAPPVAVAQKAKTNQPVVQKPEINSPKVSTSANFTAPKVKPTAVDSELSSKVSSRSATSTATKPSDLGNFSDANFAQRWKEDLLKNSTPAQAKKVLQECTGNCPVGQLQKYFQKQNDLARIDLEAVLNGKNPNSQKSRGDIFNAIRNYEKTFKDYPLLYDKNGKLLKQRLVGVDKDGRWILEEPDGSSRTIAAVDAQKKFRLDRPANGQTEDFTQPQRGDIREKTLAEAQDGDFVDVYGQRYEVKVDQARGRKVFTDVANASNKFETVIPKDFVAKPKEEVVSVSRRQSDDPERQQGRRQSGTREKDLPVETPEVLAQRAALKEPNPAAPDGANIYELKPSEMGSKPKVIEETPAVVKMREDLSKPNPANPTGAKAMIFNSDGSITPVELGKTASYPDPVPKKPFDVNKTNLPASDIKSLTKIGNVVGRGSDGVYRGELNGEPVFVKRLSKFDPNEVAMVRLVSDLDLGPAFKGVTTTQGKPSIVMSSIEDGVTIGKSNAAATRDLTTAQKKAAIEQIEKYGKILEKNGIESNDVEFMFDKKTNKLHIIDVGKYRKLPNGKMATDSKLQYDSKAKDLRQEWGIPKEENSNGAQPQKTSTTQPQISPDVPTNNLGAKPKAVDVDDFGGSSGSASKSKTSSGKPEEPVFKERRISQSEIDADPQLAKIVKEAQNLKPKTSQEVLKEMTERYKKLNPNTPEAKRLKAIWGDCL